MTRNEAMVAAIAYACKQTRQTLFVSAVRKPGEFPEHPNDWLIWLQQQDVGAESDFVVAVDDLAPCSCAGGIRMLSGAPMRMR